MKYFRHLVLLACFSTSASWAALEPWFTGPVLAPSGHTIPKGHLNFEPYAMFTDSFGVYNRNWSVHKVPDTKRLSIMPVISYGLTDYMDFQAVLPYAQNWKQDQHDSGIGDITLILGVQAYKQKAGDWLPSLRMTVGELIPVGNYQNLNPAKQGIDATGQGAFQTSFGLNFQHLSQPYDDHYLRTRLSLSATVPHVVNVKGFNAYGGGVGTNAMVDPGRVLQADLAFEYQLTQNWVPVLEVMVLDRAPSSFKGTRGRTLTGLPASIGYGEVEQVTLAPALEYNINERMGLIAGVWFSLTGKETNQFVTGAIAFNYFI